MSMSSPKKRAPKIPLHIVLIAPFVLLIVFVVGLAGYLSFQNGQQAVNTVAGQLRSEITTRIKEHLHTFLDTPHRINQINASLFRQGQLKANDPQALERHFWQQIEIFDSVTSIYFGNTAGGLVNAGREGTANSRYVIVTDGFVSGPFRKYATDSQGNRAELLTTVPDFDARTRPWYTGAAAGGKAVWSEIYILFTGQDMAIAASRPVYDDQHELLGVVSVDIFLSHLSNFLKSIEIGKTGQSFIIDRSGLLVASSTPEKLFTEPVENGPRRRLQAGDSTSPLVRSAAQFLTEQFGDYHHIAAAQQLEFELDGQRQFLQVAPIQDDYGLDWLIVVVAPESDFMAQIQANNRLTVLLIGAALLLAVGVGVVAARWITEPILRLNASAQAMAKGEWQQIGPVDWIGELGELTSSFNRMAGQLQQTVDNLTAEIVERKRAEESLRESEERLQLALKGADLGMWDWNVSTGHVVINERWAEMLGYNLAEIEPHVSAWEKLIHPDDAAAVREVLHTHMARCTPIYQAEYRLQTKAGEWKWILDTGKVLEWDEEGRPRRAAGTHQDISARKQAEEALQETLAELEQTQAQMVQQERLAAVGQLAAGVAHDFNNILTSILGFAELLQLSPDTPEAVRADLGRIINSGQRAARLIRQLLDFSGKSIYRPQQLDMLPLLKEILKFFQWTIPENIRLSLEIEPGEYLVEADPTQLQQMITNLVINARDAMPAGGELRLKLTRVEAKGEAICAGCNQAIEGDWVALTVTDTGKGIPAEVLPRIFEPFFTTKEVGQGSGLGLAQVLGIVQQQAGHVTVASQAEKGAIFTVYLPPLGPRQHNTERVKPTPLQQGQGETILLVEDDATVLAVIQTMLQHLGYQVLTATNGREAVAVYEEHQAAIALVLSDIVMPDMESDTLFNLLKAQNDGIKMALMSGYPLDQEGAKLLELGVVEWLQKPVSLSQLAQVISQVLAKK